MQETDCQDKEQMQNMCATNGGTEQCCGEHRRGLKLFCREDEAFICVLCVPRHSCHSFVLLHEAVSVYKEKLKTSLSSLELKVRDLKDVQTKNETEFQEIRERAVNLEKYIPEEFVKLHQFLHDKEQKLIYQLNSKASEILKESKENLECIKTGFTEIHSAASDTNLEIKKEVDILEERNDTDYLTTTEESVSGDTSEHGKHKANGVISEHGVNLEKYIAEEFVKLHQFLHGEEQKLIYQLNSKASEILKEREVKFEWFKTGVTEIHSAASDTNLVIKKEVDVLEERNDTDYLATTEESGLGDTTEHGKHKANGVLSAPESFEDVAVTFSAEEMKMLTKQEKELHKEVKLENYETLVSAGNGSREWSICWSQQPSLGVSTLHYPTENLQHSVQTLKVSDEHPVIPVAQLHPGYTCNMKSECDRSSIVQQSSLLCQRTLKEKKSCKCFECNKCFRQRCNVVKHERIHRGERPYKCLECSKCFKQGSHLAHHKRIHKGERPYTCPECNKCFRNKSALAHHERTHTGERPEKCPECNKCFRERSALIKHKMTHTGERPYKCPECNKCFRQRSALVRHEMTHTGERPYTCLECNKCFSQRSNLVTHERTHTEGRSYKCSECNKCFIGRSALVNHKMTHTRERPYTCLECKKCFRQRSDFVKHEKTHTGESPYKCPECNKCFIYRSALIRHKMTHTGERPYKCPECNKCFRQRSDLVRHERTHMGERP